MPECECIASSLDFPMPKLATFKLELKFDWLPKFSDRASALHGESSFIIAFVRAEHW